MGLCPSRAAPLPQRRGQILLNPEQSARARGLWRLAIKRVRKILRQRRIWSELGRYLQDPAIQDLVLGLERVRGHLIRTATPAVARQARENAAVAKARARFIARSTVRASRAQ